MLRTNVVSAKPASPSGAGSATRAAAPPACAVRAVSPRMGVPADPAVVASTSPPPVAVRRSVVGAGGRSAHRDPQSVFNYPVETTATRLRDGAEGADRNRTGVRG